MVFLKKGRNLSKVCFFLQGIELFFEEMILNESEKTPSWGERISELARETGAVLSHFGVQAADEILSVVPQFLEKIGEVGGILGVDRILGIDGLLPFTPVDNFNSKIQSAHETLDEFFNTQGFAHEDSGIRGYALPEDAEVSYAYIPFPGTGKIPVTQATDVWGWKLGDPIQNRTWWGTIPKWSKLRARFWKNEAFLRPEDYKPDQLRESKRLLTDFDFVEFSG